MADAPTLVKLIEEFDAVVAERDALRKENARLRSQTIRAGGPNRPNRRKLLEGDVNTIRLMKRAGFTQKQIADSFDVNPATISRIVRGIYHH